MVITREDCDNSKRIYCFYDRDWENTVEFSVSSENSNMFRTVLNIPYGCLDMESAEIIVNLYNNLGKDKFQELLR